MASTNTTFKAGLKSLLGGGDDDNGATASKKGGNTPFKGFSFRQGGGVAGFSPEAYAQILANTISRTALRNVDPLASLAALLGVKLQEDSNLVDTFNPGNRKDQGELTTLLSSVFGLKQQAAAEALKQQALKTALMKKTLEQGTPQDRLANLKAMLIRRQLSAGNNTNFGESGPVTNRVGFDSGAARNLEQALLAAQRRAEEQRRKNLEDTLAIRSRSEDRADRLAQLEEDKFNARQRLVSRLLSEMTGF